MDCVELTFVLFFSIHQVCGLGRRTVTEPKGSKRSDKFNSINGTGCPFQTLHTTSASAGNCVYTGNQLYDANVALLFQFVEVCWVQGNYSTVLTIKIFSDIVLFCQENVKA